MCIWCRRAYKNEGTKVTLNFSVSLSIYIYGELSLRWIPQNVKEKHRTINHENVAEIVENKPGLQSIYWSVEMFLGVSRFSIHALQNDCCYVCKWGGIYYSFSSRYRQTKWPLCIHRGHHRTWARTQCFQSPLPLLNYSVKKHVWWW